MEDSHKYIYFHTLDYTGSYTTIGYSLSITPFTFIPVFDDGVNKEFSKQKILWDFGDGTTSSSVTAVHYFKLPGWYNVKCHVLGKDGKSYVDSFSQNILMLRTMKLSFRFFQQRHIMLEMHCSQD